MDKMIGTFASPRRQEEITPQDPLDLNGDTAGADFDHGHEKSR